LLQYILEESETDVAQRHILALPKTPARA